MFVRILVSVDGPYDPAPIGSAGCCYQQPARGRPRKPVAGSG